MAVQAQQYSENLGLSLCGSQEWMEAGNGVYELYRSLQQQQQMIQNQHRNQNTGFDYNNQLGSLSNNHLLSMAFSQSLMAQVERQRHEIDQFIALQNERLRLALHEQRKQHLGILLKRLEPKTVSLLRQKDEDLANATKKTMELEDCLRRVEMENQAWQRVAKENEAMVVTLNNTLEQVRENACGFSSQAEDAESCCDCDFSHGFDIVDGEEENRAEQEQEQMRKMVCRACNSRSSCVLFLPCRHLCSCKSCEAFLVSCPVCKSVKKASIEVLMF